MKKTMIGVLVLLLATALPLTGCELLDEPFPEETETETYEELPEEVVSFVKGDHAYLVYAVDKEEGKILILYPDGKYYLYCLEEETSETDGAVG